ncbi:class F sortase [Bacillus sp. SG-1]|uniref:class F sortase n=1 Tax=Bacillus sp. SG-1 TaxID=161544 RepID=UPI0002F21F35|nr:class F sortase [Bacillus sp. SG-1]
MNSWLKKTILLYWILLISTIGVNTSAAPRESDVTVTPSPTVEVPSSAETNQADKPAAGDYLQTIEVIPEKITIPSIGMEAQVAGVGILENGEMEVPDNINQAGWFKPGVKPGGQGNAVLAGHLDGKGKPGAFYHIGKLQKGDKVEILGKDGQLLTFQVVGVESYYTDDAPLERIFGYHSDSRLNLITCSGDFDEEEHEYEERLVVYTELVK